MQADLPAFGGTNPARTVQYGTITGTDQSREIQVSAAGNADASSHSSFPAESARYHALLPHTHTRNFTLIADLTG